MPSTPTQDPPKPITDKRAAVDAAAEAADNPEVELHPTTVSAATEWFMSPSEEEVAKAKVPLNVAPAGAPENVVDFLVQVLDRDRIRDIRRECTRTLPSGLEEVDEMETNLRIAVEALLDPKLEGENLVVRGERFLDPADALKARFAYKPGLIDLLAGAVVRVSGYSTADLKEVKAAGK